MIQIQFERLDGPHGIPIYFQELPNTVKPVSLRWLVFVGSADDISVGQPGLYHWFEHVPFRGTVRFPGGYAATGDRFERYGGKIDAHTCPTCTTFYCNVPERFWREAFDVITDLAAQPLLNDEGISGEREIIRDEIQRALSAIGLYAEYHLQELLWPGHALGWDVLGSADSLQSMAPDLLRTAHAKGYDRSRCVLLAAGSMSKSELLDAVAEHAERFPIRGLAERRHPATFGSVPAWRGGEKTVRETPFPSSVVAVLFPVPQRASTEFLRQWSMLTETFNAGGLGSPLLRILREERNLVYHASVACSTFPDGGFWGFTAQTRTENIDAVLKGFWDVLHDELAQSTERYAYVQDAVRGELDMRIVDPDAFTGTVEGRLLWSGDVVNDHDHVQRIVTVPHEEVLDLLSTMRPERAHTIIFRGTQQS